MPEPRVLSVEHDEQARECAIMDPDDRWECPDAPEWRVREYHEEEGRTIEFPFCTSHMVGRLIRSGARFVHEEEAEEARREGAKKMQDACEAAIRDVYPDHHAVPIRVLDVSDVLATDSDEEDSSE